jgi:flavocytochrome c
VKRRTFLEAVGTAAAFPAAAAEGMHRIDTDVLVIGSGAAGLCAAIAARAAGCRVLIIEKMGTVGGNSVLSGGAVSVPCSPHQKIHGIDDSPEALAEDIMQAGYVSSPARALRFAREALPAWEWTSKELGVRWDPTLLTLERGHRCARTVYVESRSGTGLIFPMQERAAAVGAELMLGTALKRFIRDEETGRILGVHAERAGEPIDICASRGTVLATGGFGADPEFRRRQNYRLSAAIGTTNQPGATAEGIKAAALAGAWLLHTEYIHCLPETSPDEQGSGLAVKFTRSCAATQGIWVAAKTGRRFVNETAPLSELTNALLDRTIAGEQVIAVADAKAVSQPSSPAVTPADVADLVSRGIVEKFASLRELCGEFGIPEAALREEIAAYNDARTKGAARDAVGRPLALSALPMNAAPWYAARVLPKVYECSGGVATDENARVLSVVDDRPIPGFYAAGEATGGLHGISHLGAVGLIEAIVFGRIAGAAAAEGF